MTGRPTSNKEHHGQGICEEKREEVGSKTLEKSGEKARRKAAREEGGEENGKKGGTPGRTFDKKGKGDRQKDREVREKGIRQADGEVDDRQGQKCLHLCQKIGDPDDEKDGWQNRHRPSAGHP